VGRPDRPETTALLSAARPDAADRVRQQPEPRQPRPFRVARSAERLRRRPAPRPLRAEPRRADRMTELRGVIPITATPFDAEGRVDEDSIVTQVGVERAGILETRRGI